MSATIWAAAPWAGGHNPQLAVTIPDTNLTITTPTATLEVPLATHYTTGDKGTLLTGTCREGVTPTDLTGATIQLHFQLPGGNTITRTATITDPTNGAWSYQWADGDLNQHGTWHVEAQVTNTDNTIVQTFGPTNFYVQPEIA